MNNEEKYSVLVVYHGQDLDGLVSGAIAKIVNNILRSEMLYDVKLVGYNYDNDPMVDTWLDTGAERYDRYQFIDITPPTEWLELVSQYVYDADSKWTPKIEIFDHHKDKFEQIADNERVFRMMITYAEMAPVMKYFFDPNRSGALIYYDSLKDFDFWIGEFIGDIDKSMYVDNKSLLSKIFPEKYIRRSVEKLFGEWIYSEQLYDFVKLVSKYDTWQWYPIWCEEMKTLSGNEDYSWSPAWSPLALNEWLYSKGFENFNMKWLFDKLFGSGKADWKKAGNGIQLGVKTDEFVREGLREITKKRKEAKEKLYTFTRVLGVDVAMVFGHISFYESQVMNDVKASPVVPDEKDWVKAVRNAEVLVSYKLDFTKQVVKLSFRGLAGSNRACFDLAKDIGQDNGGGHFGAAGCRTTFERFSDLFLMANR